MIHRSFTVRNSSSMWSLKQRFLYLSQSPRSMLTSDAMPVVSDFRQHLHAAQNKIFISSSPSVSRDRLHLLELARHEFSLFLTPTWHQSQHQVLGRKRLQLYVRTGEPNRRWRRNRADAATMIAHKSTVDHICCSMNGSFGSRTGCRLQS